MTLSASVLDTSPLKSRLAPFGSRTPFLSEFQEISPLARSGGLSNCTQCQLKAYKSRQVSRASLHVCGPGRLARVVEDSMDAGLWFRILLLQFRMVEPPAKVRPGIRDSKVNQRPKYSVTELSRLWSAGRIAHSNVVSNGFAPTVSFRSHYLKSLLAWFRTRRADDAAALIEALETEGRTAVSLAVHFGRKASGLRSRPLSFPKSPRFVVQLQSLQKFEIAFHFAAHLKDHKPLHNQRERSGRP